MSQPPHSKGLERFAWATALATLCLIGIGGMVTSKEAGMAVPDWPTSYGYNMFALPFSYWVGGIFYEHSHRLFGVVVGLLTTLLASWTWGRETNGRIRWTGWIVIFILVAMLGHRGSGSADGGVQNVPAHIKLLAGIMPFLTLFGVFQCLLTRGSLRWLTLTAFFAVIFQGLLGGFRVALFADEIGVFHAALAQAFLVLICCIGLLSTQWWQRLAPNETTADFSNLRGLFAFLTVLIFAQLILGAVMRHQHAGLAVPDFPLAYGRIWPDTSESALAAVNANRTDTFYDEPITPFLIHLHMAHRFGALLVFLLGGAIAGLAAKSGRKRSFLSKFCFAWFGMICLQAILGAVTVWTDKAADIATLHVMLGAGCLVAGSLVTLITAKVCPETLNCEYRTETAPAPNAPPEATTA